MLDVLIGLVFLIAAGGGGVGAREGWGRVGVRGGVGEEGGVMGKTDRVHVIIHIAEVAAYSQSIKGTVEREDKTAQTPLFFYNLDDVFDTRGWTGGGLIVFLDLRPLTRTQLNMT